MGAKKAFLEKPDKENQFARLGRKNACLAIGVLIVSDSDGGAVVGGDVGFCVLNWEKPYFCS